MAFISTRSSHELPSDRRVKTRQRAEIELILSETRPTDIEILYYMNKQKLT